MKKLIQWFADNMLDIKIGLYARFSEWYLIPSISILKNGKFLEVTLYILWVQLYICITTYNINNES